MLTPDELKVAPDNIVALYQQLEDDIIADIARRLEKTGEITGAAEWQIYMLTEMGKDLDEIKSKIAAVNHKSKAEVENLFDEAITRSVGRDNLLFQRAGKGTLDLAKNAGMQQFIAASAAKTAGDLKNLTKSLGFKDGKQFKPIARFYQDTLNYAQFQIASGAFSYQQAIKIATAKMVESGIRVIDYESGVSTRIDVAVRRATLTGINQTAAQITLMQMGELGGEYVEVTAHAGARPSHADWQGKVYHVGGDVKGYPDFEESTGYGTGEGLCGWNCRHNFHPFFPGISERSHTDKELENIDPPPFEYDGKTYTHYEATQKQRQIERAIRKTKQQMIAYDAAGLKEDFTWSAVKLQRQKELYRDFSDKAGLRTKDERHQLFGFGKSISQKGVHAAKNVDKSLLKGYNKDKFSQAVEKVLEHGKKTNNEALMWLDLEGNEIVPFATGNNNSVAISHETMNLLRSLDVSSVISLHNHPRSSSFSDSDMSIASKLPSVKEMRVIAHDGTMYFLEIGDGKRPDRYIIEDAFYEIEDSLRDKYAAIFRITGNADAVWKEFSHEINELIAKRFGWKYRRELK